MLRVTKDDGTNSDLVKFSAGEKHELIMLYELMLYASRAAPLMKPLIIADLKSDYRQASSGSSASAS